jgi:hypothetical protein
MFVHRENVRNLLFKTLWMAKHGKKYRAAAEKVRSTLKPEFRQLGAQEIMDFLRGADVAAATPRRGQR